MKTWISVLAVSSAVFCGGAAAAPQAQDFELKGVTIGMTETQFKAIYPKATCWDSERAKKKPLEAPPFRICNLKGFSIANESAQDAAFSFYGGQLGHLRVTLKYVFQLERLVLALSQKFGKAKPSEGSLVWTLPSASIYLTEGGDHDVYLAVYSKIWNAWEREKTKTWNANAVKDL